MGRVAGSPSQGGGSGMDTVDTMDLMDAMGNTETPFRFVALSL
jgi:hypothetical protein